MTVAPSVVIVTIWSWPSSSASRVCPMKAATSDPRKFSPSPRPTTSGLLRRAPTTTPGWSACTASSVKAPSRPLTTWRIASVRSPAVSYARASSWATTSVSVSDRNVTPSACRPDLSAWKFSMMPLWISASLPSSPPRWGWALASVGPPWVAQRVCPMPVLEPGIGSASIAAVRLASLPARLRVATWVPSTSATPAESYPRYSSRAQPLHHDVQRPAVDIRPDITHDSTHGLQPNGARVVPRAPGA